MAKKETIKEEIVKEENLITMKLGGVTVLSPVNKVKEYEHWGYVVCEEKAK